MRVCVWVRERLTIRNIGMWDSVECWFCLVNIMNVLIEETGMFCWGPKDGLYGLYEALFSSTSHIPYVRCSAGDFPLFTQSGVLHTQKRIFCASLLQGAYQRCVLVEKSLEPQP